MPTWAIELSNDGSFYKTEFFVKLFELENFSFWFRARNELIIFMLKKYYSGIRSFMEIGCGTGFVLSGVASAFPYAKMMGCDVSIESLLFASSRVKNAYFMQMDVRNMPFVDEFDVVGAFDVLEHIQEDEVVLSEIFKAVKKGGGLILTIPQHPWLWSETDRYWSHVRRYTVDEAHKKIENAGFKIIRSTSFVSLLLPAMIASRYYRSNKHDIKVFDDLNISPTVNKILYLILCIERSLIKLGFSIIIGGSRLIVARKVS
ncbi:MAG: class I SAM-dependent methyltransferase [Nitrospirae bacterium]|nr:class I SAM-dependent methyltransferase [Nitrospirota bacterium]